MKPFADSMHIAQRHLMGLARQPIWIVVTLVQPFIWLGLFGKLFDSVAALPDFPADSYIEFITPGVIMMTAFFSAGWGGMAILEDINRGIVDRFLVSPAWRPSIVLGALIQSALVIVIQAMIIIGLAALLGASYENGIGGLAIMIIISALLGFGFGAMSHGFGLLIRKEESLIALMQFLLLPLTFLSGAFMPLNAVPGWIASVAKFNPVNWAIEAGRSAAMQSADWGLILSRTALLAVFAVVMVAFATRAFKVYQRQA